VRSREPIPTWLSPTTGVPGKLLTGVEEPGWKNRGGTAGAEEPGWKKSRTSPPLPVQSSQNAKTPWKPLLALALNRPKTIARSNYRVNAYFLATSRERQPWPGHCQEPQELQNPPAGGFSTLTTHFFVISRAPVPAERPHRFPPRGLFALLALLAHHFLGG